MHRKISILSAVVLSLACSSDPVDENNPSIDVGGDSTLSCEANEHIEENACVPSRRECPINNGVGEQVWEADAWGSCELLNCTSGYHDGGSGSCVPMGTCAPGYVLTEEGACGYISGPVNMQFAAIPAGTFMMGAPQSEYGRQPEEQQHMATITYDFAIGATEVTQGQWAALSMGTNPAFFQNCGVDCPVEQVDWYSALAFANELSQTAGLQECYTLTPESCADEVSDWAGGSTLCDGASFVGLNCTGYRLPTEAEWEYAYRAGTATAFYNGDVQKGWDPLDPQVDPNLDVIGWYLGNSAIEYGDGLLCSEVSELPFYEGDITCGTHNVSDKQANPWALYDMSGNVEEWVWDLFAEYPAVATDYIGPDESYEIRVARGGAWASLSTGARAAKRGYRMPDENLAITGIRLVRTLP